MDEALKLPVEADTAAFVANLARAAEALEKKHQPCMYRVHDAPDPARIEAAVTSFNAQAQSLFDEEAAAQGGIEAEDRDGVVRRVPALLGARTDLAELLRNVAMQIARQIIENPSMPTLELL